MELKNSQFNFWLRHELNESQSKSVCVPGTKLSLCSHALLHTFSALSHLRAEGAYKTSSCFKSMFLQPHESIPGPGSVLAAVHCDTAGGERGTKYLYRTHLTQYSYCQARV